MPEVVYIPAVKDVSDEVKTRETSSFGRILGILTDLIHKTEQIEEIKASFAELDGLLNKQENEQGDVIDDRIAELRQIENKVSGFIRDQFREVSIDIEIPPPDLKTVFSSARIYLNDGVRGEVETKGDGLKRAVTFALLRTFVDLRNEQRERDKGRSPEETAGRYLFLFEEPELYLHPNAQRVLFDALKQISDDHQVCVSTHSPYFFSPAASGTFLRLKKVSNPDAPVSPPIADVRPIDLRNDITAKDAFQIICYENNSAAFFCDRVVLVEGDCDVIYLQHLAKVLDPTWDFVRRNVAVIRIGGKGNFARYRTFFEAFGVEVRIIADLDSLSDQFSKLGADAEAERLHSQLIQQIDLVIQRDASAEEVKTALGKQAVPAGDRNQTTRVATEKDGSHGPTRAEERTDFEALPGHDRDLARRRVLASYDDNTSESKNKLIGVLRRQGINVLSEGSIENYYPEGCSGPDKPSKALSACSHVKCVDAALACSPRIEDPDEGVQPELLMIFRNIFHGMS